MSEGLVETSSEQGSGGLMPRSMVSSSKRQIFLDIVKQSNISCQNGDYATAVTLYTEALNIDPNNHILYSNRSAAFIKLGQFSRALQDSLKAIDLNPKWPKCYYRQGVALQCLGKHSEAMTAFSCGLAEDPKSSQLFNGLIEAALKSPLKRKLEGILENLKEMKLDKSSFVVISVIGQELLSEGYCRAAVAVLENALRINTSNLKLKGSVHSALSSAYWALNSIDKAISHMQEDLEIVKALGDVVGECRSHGNLGSAFFSKGNYKEALTCHRYQLVLAMKCKHSQSAAAALTSLGHVYTSIGDYSNALASHKQCVQLVKQMDDLLHEAREIGNVGAVYLVMGDFDNAIDCHMEHLRIAKQLGNKVEEARAYSNLGSSYHYRRNFEQAITFHKYVLQISKDLNDKSVEARAYAGLGHAARCMGDVPMAKSWHEKQLDMALVTKDKVLEGRACSNLGIVYQLLGDNDAALKLHQAHLTVAMSLHDRAGMGRAYGNIGNAYNAMGYYDQAIKYHKQELAISKEVADRSSEASTHGNLAVAYQALGMHEKALVHYHSHLNISRELKDTTGESCALLNLGNCHSSQGDFSQAIPFYEKYLMISQEVNDVDGEAKACHFLGFAHYSIGNFKEAARYYEQDLSLAKDLKNTTNMGRAYCNLGLTHLALGNMENALECQKYFLSMAHSMKSTSSELRALGNIGNVLLKMKKHEEAVKLFQKQVMVAKSNEDKGFESNAYGALGTAYRLMKRYDRALGFHTQELTILQEISDARGECRAHGNLGAVHMALGNFTSAIKCYDEMIQRAKELNDSVTEAQAYANLGIAHMNMKNNQEALNVFKLQLSILEPLCASCPNSKINPVLLIEKGRGYSNLGDCYSSMKQFEEAIKSYERSLKIFSHFQIYSDLDKVYKSLGNVYKNAENYQQGAEYFEKRLTLCPIICKDLDHLSSLKHKGAIYGDLGETHLNLGHFDQALSCFETQLSLSKEGEDQVAEGETLSSIGKCYQALGDMTQALKFFDADLKIAQDLNLISAKARGYNNVGLIEEASCNYEQALLYQEHHLKAVTQLDRILGKAEAFSSIGRIHHFLGNDIQALAYLQQSLQLIEAQKSQEEEEAKIRYFLGLAFWRHGNLESAQSNLEKSSDLLEEIRQNVQKTGSEYSLTLFDKQIASYQALMRIFIEMGRHDLSLLVAEKSRALANSSLSKRNETLLSSCPSSTLINSMDALYKKINLLRSAVIYYSVSGECLYSWLIMPERGIVKFHESCANNDEEVTDGEEGTPNMGALLERYIMGTRDSLGVENSSNKISTVDVDSDGGDLWSQHVEELGDKLNQDSDKTGYLRMVSRNHRFNCSSYSLSSLFSVVSATGSVKSNPSSRPGSMRSKRSSWQGPSSLRALYSLLIAPFEEELNILDKTCFEELIIIADTELVLTPFSILRPCNSEEYLCEKFKIVLAPSISSIKVGKQIHGEKDACSSSYVILGNPKLPKEVTNQWGWSNIPRAESESNMVSEVLKAKSIVGLGAERSKVIREMCEADCIHLATHVSWKLSAIVLSPVVKDNRSSDSASDSDEMPSFSEYLLTAADLLRLKLKAKIVVLSSCHLREKNGVTNGENVTALIKAILTAGASSVLLTLWPVPETASTIFFRAFYSSLLQGSKVSHALTEAMLTVQNAKHFSHPANWSGYILIGTDVQLFKKIALTSRAIRELMKTPDRSRDAFRVTLHLIEKSLQRITNGQKKAMYTTHKSIENKVGNVCGWKEVLMSVGFRFEGATNGLPAAVFFPQSDPGERLTKCSSYLQALLGLTHPSLHALAKLLTSPLEGEQVIAVLREAIAKIATKDDDSEKNVKVQVKLWGVVGCHELLSSLGFDLIEVGQEEVLLSIGQHSNLRMLQFALQACLVLFDNIEAEIQENSLYDTSSSMESLEFETEDFCVLPPAIQPSVYFPLRYQLASGKGAFTNYVKSRGEPDGHTNTNTDGKSIEAISLKKSGSSNNQGTILRNPNLSGLIPPVAPTLRRIDSSSSSSSMTDWEMGLCTVKRRGPAHHLISSEATQHRLSTGFSLPEEISSGGSKERNFNRSYHSGNSKVPEELRVTPPNKRVTWKHNENVVSQPATSAKPWNLPGNAPKALEGIAKGQNTVHPNILRNSALSQIGPDLPINDVYHDRDMGLDLAPSLSNLLLNGQGGSIGHIDIPTSGDKSDIDAGALSMDDSLSTFDQLSLVGETVTHPKYQRKTTHASMYLSNGGRRKKKDERIDSSKHNGKGSSGSHKFSRVNAIISSHDGVSSSSSSKSSPSDLSRRDEGDGRSLTDSQYGSYSPSMAQNEIIHRSTGPVYFTSENVKRGTGSNDLYSVSEDSMKRVDLKSSGDEPDDQSTECSDTIIEAPNSTKGKVGPQDSSSHSSIGGNGSRIKFNEVNKQQTFGQRSSQC